MGKGYAIKWLETVDSTNNEILRHADSLDNLSVAAARCQTAGRGQRGNSWKTENGKNLTFSILLRFAMSDRESGNLCHAVEAEKQFAVSEAGVLAQCRFLKRHGIDARIKWPNDIYVSDRKISGMLVENSLSGHRLRTSVMGIGLNVNQRVFPPELPNPTSMSLITGREYDLPSLLEEFMSDFTDCMDLLALPPEDLRHIYEDSMYRLGIESRFADLTSRPAYLPADPVITPGAGPCMASSGTKQAASSTSLPVFSGIIRGITPAGLLRVELSDGTVRTFSFKEIGYVISPA